MSPKFRPAEEVDEETPDPAGVVDEDSDSDETPRPKLVKGKAKAAPKEEIVEEKPAKKVTGKKKPVVQKEEDVEETEETPSPKKVASKKAPKATKERKQRETIFDQTGRPYGSASLIGKCYAKAEKGILVVTLNKFIEDNKESKKGGTWIVSRLRSGHTGNGKYVWKVISDGKGEGGVLKIGAPRAA